jgi:transmembrane sensor
MSGAAFIPAGPEARAQAAEWCLRLGGEDLSVADEIALRTWLDADPAHVALLETAMAAWGAVGEQASRPRVIALRSAALDDAHRAQRSQGRAGRAERTAWLRTAAVVLVIVGGLVAGGVALYRPRVLETAQGERHTFTLRDGSVVSLDAATRLKVRYQGRQRRLWLERGRASFVVAKDPLRPFSVAAGGKVVVATGTQFSVELLRKQVRVVLFEGKVAVLGDEGEGRPWKAATPSRQGEQDLRPGQQLLASTTIAPSAPGRITRVDAPSARAWEGGQLIFEAEPLDQAVERLNRYGGTPLRIGDARAGDIRISGVFRSDDVAAFVTGVTAVFPVRARREGDAVVLESVAPG